MKQHIYFLFFIFSFICSSAGAKSDTLTVRIKGMRCGECAHKVKTALRQVQGVGGIAFNLERRTATIAYDPQQTSKDSIEARLTATGRYKPSPYSKDEVIRRAMGQRMADMHCQKCANRIMARLQKIEGMDSLAPHIDKHYMFIRYDANRTCKDSIRAAITKLGYTPVNYYTSPKVDYAYYTIPAEAATQETVEGILALDAVDDVTVNPVRRSLAVTYFCQEISADQLLAEIKKLGVDAVVPPAHQCKEQPKQQ